MNSESQKRAASSVIWLQVSAGQGPKECGWVAAQVCQRILQSAHRAGVTAELVEYLAFDKALRNQDLIEPDAYLSGLIRLEGTAVQPFARTWAGSIKWQGESPYRPKHKRINWFVGVALVEMPAHKTVALEDLQRSVRVETMKSGGPGGQHVNKTNSAVRVTHLPTGIQLRVDSDRSQHRNRHLALERLQLLLAAGEAKADKTKDHSRWLEHFEVKRGNPLRLFAGATFTER